MTTGRPMSIPYRVFAQDWPGYDAGEYGAIFGRVTRDKELALQWADGLADNGWNVQVRDDRNGRVIYRRKGKVLTA